MSVNNQCEWHQPEAADHLESCLELQWQLSVEAGHICLRGGWQFGFSHSVKDLFIVYHKWHLHIESEFAIIHHEANHKVLFRFFVMWLKTRMLH